MKPHNLELDSQNLSASTNTTLAASSVANRIIETLLKQGIDTHFGIPGGPICPIFEALRTNPLARLIHSRHESQAAFSAASYYRATGKTAALIVTAGPGLTNAVSGITSAYLERIPLLVICGDVAWATHGGRLAQDSGPEGINAEQLISPVTCAQIRVTNAQSAISQTVAALNAAQSPIRPGPTLLVLPIDRAMEESPLIDIHLPKQTYVINPDEKLVHQAAIRLAKAKRPLLVLGGGCLEHADTIQHLVHALDIPFVTTPRAKGVVSENHPCSLRNGGLAASCWAKAYTKTGVDVALVLGTDLDDTSVGPTPYISKKGFLIHVDVNPQVFNRNLPTSLAISGDLGVFAKALQTLALKRELINGCRQSLMAEIYQQPAHDVAGFENATGLQIPPHRAIADLQKAVGPTARFISDIGEHMLFALHYLKAHGPQDFHIQLNLGSMGSGIAGATGLALGDPSRTVVCICGDGGMQMCGMEILTSVKHKLPIIYAVFNDSRYNMVHHGMKQIFGSAEDYDVVQIDFTVWASSMGIQAENILRPGQITAELLSHLNKEGGPIVLDIRIDKEARVTSGGRVEALQHMSMLNAAVTEEG